MNGQCSSLLKDNREAILSRWKVRCLKEVPAATTVSELALQNSLPLYLDHLCEALATNRKMDFKSVFDREEEASRIGRLHGADRAKDRAYLLTAVIFEYHILREVIFEVLESERPLKEIQRDIILDSVEQAVNDAAVRFTEIHTEIQQKFVNTLSHDLKNPLAAAKMNLQIMLSHLGLPDSAINSTKKITANLNRLEAMIHNLLDGSRVRAGEHLALVFSLCNLAAIAKDVIEEMTIVHGDRFKLDSPTTVSGIWSADGLQRSIENLVENAVKYSTPDTTIFVSLVKDNTSVQISVQNDGNPIPTEEIPMLFLHRRRTKEATERSRIGWGLGLTLVKEVIEAHKGQIRVESSQALGTRFIIEIPG